MDHDEDANGDRREKKFKHTMPAINWNINFYWLLHGCHNSLAFEINFKIYWIPNN